MQTCSPLSPHIPLPPSSDQSLALAGGEWGRLYRRSDGPGKPGAAPAAQEISTTGLPALPLLVSSFSVLCHVPLCPVCCRVPPIVSIYLPRLKCPVCSHPLSRHQATGWSKLLFQRHQNDKNCESLVKKS